MMHVCSKRRGMGQGTFKPLWEKLWESKDLAERWHLNGYLKNEKSLDKSERGTRHPSLV